MKMFSKLILVSLLLTMFVSLCSATPCISGVWKQQYINNSGTTTGINDSVYWPEAVREVGGDNGILDIVVDCAQTWKENGKDVYWGYMAFPGTQTNYTYYAPTDIMKPILDQAQASGKKIILNIQPYKEDPTTIINQVLSHYNLTGVIGVAVDLEFVMNANSEHCNNSQRDAWLNAVRSHIPNGELYLITYHSDFYNYFPADAPNVVFMYDGLNAPQSYILSIYSTFNYSQCGIYTGYASNTPTRCATDAQIMAAQPKTVLIDHADYDISQAPTTPLNWITSVKPTANWSIQTGGLCALSPIQFTDLSQNATSWNWNFGDGNTSTQQNPTNIYSSAGNYTVNLTVSNLNGTNSKLAVINVSGQSIPPVLPIADFTSNKVSGYAPLNVQFIDLSQNVISWNWNFGDRGTATSGCPAHTYSAAGNYTVTLTATNSGGSNTITKVNYINAILKKGHGE